jgi:predicted nucleic acid-binding protein
MTAVTDAGPLIALAKLNHLHLLPLLYSRLIVPYAVHHECVVVGRAEGYADAAVIAAFLEKQDCSPRTPASVPAALSGDIRLGQGEREAIALAAEQRSLLLIDDVYARAVAEEMGLQTAGTLGVLVEAYHREFLGRDTFDELLTTIESRQDIWIHPALCRRVRSEVLQE